MIDRDQHVSYENGFDELDLALVDALQMRPRAAWALLGATLGISGSTAARRWERLTRSGLAWLTGYGASDITRIAYVEVDCLATNVRSVATDLAARGWVLSVEHVSGSCDLLITISVLDLPTLATSIAEDIGALPGVTSVRVRLATHVYQEGSHWRAGSLDHVQRQLLQNAVADGSDPSRYATLGLDDLPLLTLIGADGRASYTSIAARLGTTEHTARRRLQRLMDAGRLIFRCDFAYQLAGWPVTAIYRAHVPSANLSGAADLLSRVPDVRLCAAITGQANLLLAIWLRSVEHSHQMETLLARQVPSLQVIDRAISLNTVKRMGRLLDEHGRAIGTVPMVTRFPDVMETAIHPS